MSYRPAWLLLLTVAVGCQPASPPEPTETLVVYSLKPMGKSETKDFEPGQASFNDWPVLGSTSVMDPKLRKEILDAVQKGIDDADQDAGAHTKCIFNPRHGLRRVGKDGKVTDTLICFECKQVQVIVVGETQSFDLQHKGRVIGRSPIRVTTRRPQKLLNDTLRAAGVKLADGADEGE